MSSLCSNLSIYRSQSLSNSIGKLGLINEVDAVDALTECLLSSTSSRSFSLNSSLIISNILYEATFSGANSSLNSCYTARKLGIIVALFIFKSLNTRCKSSVVVNSISILCISISLSSSFCIFNCLVKASSSNSIARTLSSLGGGSNTDSSLASSLLSLDCCCVCINLLYKTGYVLVTLTSTI